MKSLLWNSRVFLLFNIFITSVRVGSSDQGIFPSLPSAPPPLQQQQEQHHHQQQQQQKEQQQQQKQHTLPFLSSVPSLLPARHQDTISTLLDLYQDTLSLERARYLHSVGSILKTYSLHTHENTEEVKPMSSTATQSSGNFDVNVVFTNPLEGLVADSSNEKDNGNEFTSSKNVTMKDLSHDTDEKDGAYENDVDTRDEGTEEDAELLTRVPVFLKYPLLWHVTGWSSRDCFPSIKPSKELSLLLRSSTARCLRDAVNRLNEFKNSLPCEDIREILLEGIREQGREQAKYYDSEKERPPRHTVHLEDHDAAEQYEAFVRGNKDDVKEQALNYEAIWLPQDELLLSTGKEPLKSTIEDRLASVAEDVGDDKENYPHQLQFHSRKAPPSLYPQDDVQQTLDIEALLLRIDSDDNPLDVQGIDYEADAELLQYIPGFQGITSKVSQSKTRQRPRGGGRRSKSTTSYARMHPARVFLIHSLMYKLRQAVLECQLDRLGLWQDGGLHTGRYRAMLAGLFSSLTHPDVRVVVGAVDECEENVSFSPSTAYGGARTMLECVQDRVNELCMERRSLSPDDVLMEESIRSEVERQEMEGLM